MRGKLKTFLGIAGILLAIGLIEQLSGDDGYFSYRRSNTHTEDKRVAPPAVGVTSVTIERPFFRWVPLIKYGETVYIHTYQTSDPGTAVFGRTATTRTKLLVVGFCPARRYDRLADEPFEKVHASYLEEFQPQKRPPEAKATLRTASVGR